MECSKEAHFVLELIKWVANKGSTFYAVIGHNAIKKNISKQLGWDLDDDDVDRFIDELIDFGHVRKEDCKTYNKYWLTNPVFYQAAKSLAYMLEKYSTNGRKYKLVLSCENELTAIIYIDIVYVMKDFPITIAKHPLYIDPESAKSLKNKNTVKAAKFVENLVLNLEKIEGNLIDMINYNHYPEMYQRFASIKQQEQQEYKNQGITPGGQKLH